ncbi:XdhC family protein [Aquisalimonas sp.]|uniref:XdhC family protein n=1 Tax=unclassified Aquisalimonas TaxID=2644645 RepID=UPI0025B81ED5|nr:XdhC family protein [Aquisalimonas sp.]
MATDTSTHAVVLAEDDDLAILGTASQWLESGRNVAIARVIQTWGSSPRPVGSILAVDDRMHMIGSVSGGCVESAVVQEAQGVMAGDAPRVLEFGVTNEVAWSVGLACGGTIRILVEPLTAEAR